MLGRVKIFVPFLSRSVSHHIHFIPREIRDEAKTTYLLPRLRVKIRDNQRKMSQPEGPEGRLKNLRHTLTALIKYERIEGGAARIHETQGYAERLICDAIRYGDCHTPTMEMADFWILEKHLIHKLFKVLVPRYEKSTLSYTRFFRIPRPYFGDGFYKPREDSYIDEEFAYSVRTSKGLLELRGNPYPPLLIPQISNPRSLHNALLWAAREEKRTQLVEASLKEEGLLNQSPHIKRILEKSVARSEHQAVLGDDLSQLEVNESQGLSENIEAKSELFSEDLKDKSVNEEVKVKSEEVRGKSEEVGGSSEERSK